MLIVTYALTSFFGGYVSGGLYAAMDGKHWMRAMVLTAGAYVAAAGSCRLLLAPCCLNAGCPHVPALQLKYCFCHLSSSHTHTHTHNTQYTCTVLFPGVCCAIALGLNTIAIFYGSLAAVPFGYILIVVLLWAFLSIPLCVLGTVFGRKYAAVPNNPCRVKRIPSPIPLKAWYLTPVAISVAGGLLPFGSIFIEMYFIFTSFWNYKVGMVPFGGVQLAGL